LLQAAEAAVKTKVQVVVQEVIFLVLFKVRLVSLIQYQ
jgi:hypothetical protein